MPQPSSSKRKSSRNKKTSQGQIYIQLRGRLDTNASTDTPAGIPATGRRSKKTHKDADTTMTGTDEKEPPPPPVDDEDEEDDDSEGNDDEHLSNPYGGRFDDNDPLGQYGGFGGLPPHGLSSTLRALSGMMSGISTKFRDILGSLKQKEDPSVQLIALQELSEILLVSTEDNLAGHFSPDAFIKELVLLMQPSDFGEENPEMMLLACRCLANLMEALPSSTANIVYGGAVPILCQKLLEIHFIDLAEQSLSVSQLITTSL